MEKIKRVGIICLCIMLILSCGKIVSQKNKIEQLENVKTEVKVIDNYSFRVRSKATTDVYTAVAARIQKNGEMQIKIYNYYTDKYEWYPIYKFYKYIAIATYVDKKYAQETFGTVDTDKNFIDFRLYDEKEL